MTEYERLELFTQLTLEANVDLLKKLKAIGRDWVVFYNGIGLDTRYRLAVDMGRREYVMTREQVKSSRLVRVA